MKIDAYVPGPTAVRRIQTLITLKGSQEPDLLLKASSFLERHQGSEITALCCPNSVHLGKEAKSSWHSVKSTPNECATIVSKGYNTLNVCAKELQHTKYLCKEIITHWMFV